MSHMNHMNPASADSDSTLPHAVVSTDSVFGAPCWVSLTTRDLEAAEAFYTAVLGWTFRTGRLGERFRTALAGDVPVAGLAAVASVYRMAVAWTPYFAVPSADETVARSRERGGTTAVGPLAFPPGRAALLADRDGAAFGIWEGQLATGWEEWRKAAPVSVRLHTRDAFDAAIFYGEVLQWAGGGEGCCEVQYDGAEVVLRSGERRSPASTPGRWARPRTRRSAPTGRSTSPWTTCRRAWRRRGRTAEPSCGGRKGRAKRS